jgi:hypothetical protein
MQIDALFFSDTCFLLCAACQEKTQNTFLSPTTFQTHCVRCNETGTWQLDSTAWPPTPVHAEEQSLSNDRTPLRKERFL